MFDTIASIATAPGEAAIGIVRMSGAHSKSILDKLFNPAKKMNDFLPWRFYYGTLQYGGTVIDEVLCVYFKGPSSYTREDMVEIHCHGGHSSVRTVLKAVLGSGARLAEPGEYTRRAYLNGRLDLVQAESVMDIIHSYTETSNGVALRQLKGDLSRHLKDMCARLDQARVNMAVSLDYPDEDIEEITHAELGDLIESIRVDILSLLRAAETGRVIRDGVKTAIIGRPNVGKSSILNALLQEERAIVTDIPGTTRDVIEEILNVRGIPICIMDTAGIRDTEDFVEQIGVRRSLDAVESADLIICVLNSSEALHQDDYEILKRISEKKVILVLNKIDLSECISDSELFSILPDAMLVRTSVLEQIGLRAIEDAIEESVLGSGHSSLDGVCISNIRHIQLLESVNRQMESLLSGIKHHTPYEYLDVDVQVIISTIHEIIGESCADDLIDRIFSQFCLGK